MMSDFTQKYKDVCIQNNSIDSSLFAEYGVKRGLRDKNGKGVLSGITNISLIKASDIVDGKVKPCDGQLFYRGYNIYDLTNGMRKDHRFGFEEITYLLLFGNLPTKSELKEFSGILAKNRRLPTNFVRDVIMKAPSQDIMNSLTKSVLTLSSYDDKVALQFYEKKGDLQISENGRKSNTVMPKLILLYEDIEEEGKPGSKRYRLTGKHYFGGVYEGAEANEDLWLEVQQYIYDNYDTEYLENVYIAGDGAPWIVSGCQVLEKSKFVLDKFHLWKYISAATSHLLDSTEDARELIYAAIREKNQEEVQRLLRKCGASALTPGKQKEIEACRKYIQNNWLGIIVRYDDAGADWGCSAEGQISHVLSARESSRPMGWSKTGVHKMTQLRVFTRNGGNVIDLLEYQHKKEQMQKRIKKQDELVREVKRNHRISGEETLRKEIPGLERASMTWMRDMIYGYGA